MNESTRPNSSENDSAAKTCLRCGQKALVPHGGGFKCRNCGAEEPPAAYNYENPSRFALAECEAAVGKKATMTLTGSIVAADESNAGAFVKFQPDERFGFGDYRFGVDLDVLDVLP